MEIFGNIGGSRGIYSLSHVKIEQKIHYLTFDLGVKVTHNDAKYPLDHVTYSPAKFEVATSNS